MIAWHMIELFDVSDRHLISLPNFFLYRTTITMSNEIHEYFTRTSSEWNITDFLKCNEEQFQRKIDKYLTSLDAIMALEQGKRKTKAEFLLRDIGR